MQSHCVAVITAVAVPSPLWPNRLNFTDTPLPPRPAHAQANTHTHHIRHTHVHPQLQIHAYQCHVARGGTRSGLAAQGRRFGAIRHPDGTLGKAGTCQPDACRGTRPEAQPPRDVSSRRQGRRCSRIRVSIPLCVRQYPAAARRRPGYGRGLCSHPDGHPHTTRASGGGCASSPHAHSKWSNVSMMVANWASPGIFSARACLPIFQLPSCPDSPDVSCLRHTIQPHPTYLSFLSHPPCLLRLEEAKRLILHCYEDQYEQPSVCHDVSTSVN